MRLHISLDDEIVAELDRRVGERKRSAFIAAIIRQALDDASRWEQVLGAAGSIGSDGGEWGDDPSRWVREERFADSTRVG